MTHAEDEVRGRHFTVTADGRVDWEGEDRGIATWFFHRDEPLPEHLDTLWGEAGVWEADLRWDPASALGQKFFRLCQAELLTLSEANRVVAWLKAHGPHGTPPVVRRIADTDIRGELPARMVSSHLGTVIRRDLRECGDGLGFPVAGFAEPAHPRFGYPIGWYGWPCRDNDL